MACAILSGKISKKNAETSFHQPVDQQQDLQPNLFFIIINSSTLQGFAFLKCAKQQEMLFLHSKQHHSARWRVACYHKDHGTLTLRHIGGSALLAANYESTISLSISLFI
jgi:hypothetical protein